MRRAIGPDEILLAAALVLLALGAGLVWLPAAFLVPGGVLLWLALPSRAPLILRSPAPPAPSTTTKRGEPHGLSR